MRRGLIWAGMAATAPFVLLLVALPVGFVMELGKQVRLRVVNRTDRPLRVTPLRSGHEWPDQILVAAPSLHPFLPLPSFRAADHAVPPGTAILLHHRARRSPLRLAVREADGRLFELALPFAGPDLEAGREIVIDAASVFVPASSGVAKAVDSGPPLLAWSILLAAPLGSFAFFRLNRARRRSPENPPPPRPPSE